MCTKTPFYRFPNMPLALTITVSKNLFPSANMLVHCTISTQHMQAYSNFSGITVNVYIADQFTDQWE